MGAAWLPLLQKQKSFPAASLYVIFSLWWWWWDRREPQAQQRHCTAKRRMAVWNVRSTYRTHKHAFQLLKQSCMLKRSFVELDVAAAARCRCLLSSRASYTTQEDKPKCLPPSSLLALLAICCAGVATAIRLSYRTSYVGFL